MTTLTESITQELLDAVDDPAGLEGIIQKHARSKGPLYAALAQATSCLKERLVSLSSQSREVEKDLQQVQEQAKSAQRQQELTKTALRELEGDVRDKRGIVDRADELAGLGFGLPEVVRLHEMMLELAASQDSSPQEAVAAFFDEVDRCRGSVSRELEHKRAEAATGKARVEAERWQAEALAAEAKCKARKATIDVVEGLLASGVKEGDVRQWGNIMAKAGLSPEDLAGELKRYGSIEKTVRAKQKRSEDLGCQVTTLEARLKALRKERDGLHAAIEAVRDEALSQVRQAGQGVLGGIKRLKAEVEDYGALREEAAGLRRELSLAKALHSGDPKAWGAVDAHGMLNLLGAVLVWSGVNGFNPQLPPPKSVRMIGAWTKVGFADLLQWAALGLASFDRCPATK